MSDIVERLKAKALACRDFVARHSGNEWFPPGMGADAIVEAELFEAAAARIELLEGALTNAHRTFAAEIEALRAQIQSQSAEIARLKGEVEWLDISTAPRDGTRFWGNVGDDAIAMFWHPEFEAFVSYFRRMTMAPGYMIDGKSTKDHSPVIHHPTHWTPIRPLPSPPVIP